MSKNCSTVATLIALDMLKRTRSIRKVCHIFSSVKVSSALGLRTKAIVSTSNASLHTVRIKCNNRLAINNKIYLVILFKYNYQDNHPKHRCCLDFSVPFGLSRGLHVVLLVKH